MYEQYDQWWLDNKVHYTYLAFSIIFLISVHFLQNDGLGIKILLIIHLLLLIGKLCFNTFMMKLFFGIKAKRENKKDLYERTIKIDNGNKNVYRRDPRSTAYHRHNRIEDVMFGSKDTNKRSHYDSLYQSKVNQQNRTFDYNDNQGAAYYKNNNNFYPQSTNRRSYVNEQSPLGQSRSPYNNRQFDQSNIHIRPFDNLQSYTNTRSHYDNFDGRQQYRRNQIISRTNNNISSSNDHRFDQPAHLNDFERYPDRSGNLNPHYQRRLQQQTISRQVIPLQKQFIKYNFSRQAAIRMILLVRSYFEERIKEYKMNQTVNLNKLKFLIKKMTSSNYEPSSIESMIVKAKQMVSSSIINTFNVRDKQSTAQLQDILSKIYFSGSHELNDKQSYLRFYKEQTTRSVLQNINIQIVTTQKLHTSADMMPRFTYQIYYHPQRDFCYYHREQQNHMYNLEETFLLLILACKNDFPTTTLIRDIMAFANLRNDAPPILY